MKSPIIIGILGLPLILCSCFLWSPLPHRPMSNIPPTQVEDQQKTDFTAAMKSIWGSLDQQYTILGYLPSIDCSSPKFLPLGVNNQWERTYQMTCTIKDKSKAQEESAYVEKVFWSSTSLWDGIIFSENIKWTLKLNDNTAVFTLINSGLNGLSQSDLYFKSIEAKYNLSQKIQNNIGEVKSSNISVKESLVSFPVSIQNYFQSALKIQPTAKLILSTLNWYWYDKLFIDSVPTPEGLHIFETKWPTINNEAYSMTIIYSGNKIWDGDKAKMDFIANPKNVEAIYLGNITGNTSFLLKPDVLK